MTFRRWGSFFWFCLLRSRCFSPLGASSGRFWVSRMTLPTLQNQAPASAAARILKNQRLRSEGGLGNVLGLSWASFGRSWGSLGGFLGFSAVLLGASWGLLGSQGTILGSSWVLLLSFFSALLVRSSSKSLFFISSGLFGSILGLQDDPPTLKNRAPASAAARFLKNRRFRSEDGLESAWGLSWARFGCSRGLLGNPFGGLGGFLGAPGGYQASFKVILELSLASFWRLRCPSS